MSVSSSVKRLREEFRQTTFMNKQELLHLADVTGRFYSEIIEHVQPGLSEPKKKDMQKPGKKKRHVDQSRQMCNGPYWRTPEVVERLVQIEKEEREKKGNAKGRPKNLKKYKCTQKSSGQYNGPAQTDGSKLKICTTCWRQYKHDKASGIF